ncbi:MAG: hypothetical protein K940chlam2_01176, partial [Chlamydiae bacterium]|nr:hypothetical protein [Chlamydiota bacterium]
MLLFTLPGDEAPLLDELLFGDDLIAEIMLFGSRAFHQ